MISFNKKLIFVHINKTPATSIQKALSNYGVKKLEENNKIETELTYKQSQHFNTIEYRKYLGEDYDNYYKFSVVRNPFDRVVSYYYGGAIQSGLSFKEWVLDRYRDENYKDYIRMYSDFTHWFSKDEIDYVLKFENLDNDFDKLKETLNLDCSLSKNNVNKTRTHYRDYYDDETIDVIEKHFEKELNAFNYKFDGER